MQTEQESEEVILELDEDIIKYFVSEGIDYQNRINALLRHYVTEQKRKVEE